MSNNSYYFVLWWKIRIQLGRVYMIRKKMKGNVYGFEQEEMFFGY